MKQILLLKKLFLILMFAFLCGACNQASTQSASSNTINRTASPLATVSAISQESPTPQSANKNATSVNANTALQDDSDKGKIQRVQFARGRNSATFKDAVYQNRDNEYLFEAKAGQTMTVSMKVDKNSKSSDSAVVFQIIKAGEGEPFAKPDGNFWRGRLSETGGYVIRVISFTDNNGYKLKITIR